MIYCIPLDEATEEFYASVARAAGLPIEQVLRDRSLPHGQGSPSTVYAPLQQTDTEGGLGCGDALHRGGALLSAAV